MMLLCVMLLASGCVSNPTRVGVEFCEHARVLYWSDQSELDATPTPLVRQIVAHNEKVARLCRR